MPCNSCDSLNTIFGAFMATEITQPSYFLVLLREILIKPSVRTLWRVRNPLVGTPHGVCEMRPFLFPLYTGATISTQHDYAFKQ